MPERPYVPGEDDDEVLKLRSKVWGADHPHTNPDFFKWLFQETPSGPGSGIVSVENDTIIGFAGIVRRKAWMGSKQFDVAHGLEFMVDPDLGGMKSGRVGMRILRAHLKLGRELGLDFTLNYPNERSVRMIVSGHCGYETVLEPSLFVRPLGGFTLAVGEDGYGFRQAFKTTFARMASAYSSCVARQPESGIDMEWIDQVDDRFDDFFRDFTSDGQLRFARDASTLRWRFNNHPIYDYRILAATRSGEVVGYVVVSPRHVFDTDSILICDLCVLGDDTDLAEALISEIVDDARKNGVSIVVSQQTLSGKTSARALFRSGFIKVPQRFNPKRFRMVAADFTEQGRLATDPSNWFFSWGDMDVV